MFVWTNWKHVLFHGWEVWPNHSRWVVVQLNWSLDHFDCSKVQQYTERSMHEMVDTQIILHIPIFDSCKSVFICSEFNRNLDWLRKFWPLSHSTYQKTLIASSLGHIEVVSKNWKHLWLNKLTDKSDSKSNQVAKISVTLFHSLSINLAKKNSRKN